MIILASASKARRKLIKICKKNVLFNSSNIDEQRFDNEDIYDYLQRITYLKGIGFVNSRSTIVSADTIIVFRDMVIGKPKDKSDALKILSTLSGHTHFCFSGVTIISDVSYSFFVEYAVVKMQKLTKEQLGDYLDKKEYIGKAAGYAIQGYASSFMSVIKGDITTVIGLPMKRLCRII